MTAPGVLEAGELPDTWGHMGLVGRKLITMVAAPDLKPEPLAREFVAALLRRASQLSESLLRERVQADLKSAREEMDKRIAEEVQRQVALQRV